MRLNPASQIESSSIVGMQRYQIIILCKQFINSVDSKCRRLVATMPRDLQWSALSTFLEEFIEPLIGRPLDGVPAIGSDQFFVAR